MNQGPLVSVLTPVYNGGEFLGECIESVLKQEYGNYEYLIVNNCSKDRTLEIALEYAKKDSRIRVHNNKDFVGVIENHNNAFRLISPQSKYCKVVSADDWLFPECIKRMVDLAEANPSIGIISSYQLSGGGTDWENWSVRYGGVPNVRTVIPGREVCRTQMLGGPYVFGAPTSILYRSDLIRGQEAFYPNSTAEADTSACYKHLRNAEFGFVHQVLSYERVHTVRQTTTSQHLNAYLSSFISDLLAYGSFYMTEPEVKKRLGELVDAYYAYLADGFIDYRDEKFWLYHRKRLEGLGLPLDNAKLTKVVVRKLPGVILNPRSLIHKLSRHVRRPKP